MQRKANPLEVKIEIVDQQDWKATNQLDIKVKGLFRDSGWRIKNYSYVLKGDVIQINMNTEKRRGMALMVLTPFEFLEKIPVIHADNKYKIRVIIDGDEYATKLL